MRFALDLLGRVAVVLAVATTLLLFGCTIGATVKADEAVLPLAIYSLGLARLSFWRTSLTLVVFATFFPIVAGLGQPVLLAIPAPISTGLGAILAGWTARWLCGVLRKTKVERAAKDDGVREPQRRLLTRLTDFLLLATILSFVVQLTGRGTFATFFPTLLSQPSIGFGSDIYFSVSARLWLTGLLLFRYLLWDREPLFEYLPAMFLIWSVSLAGFAGFQVLTDVPYPTHGYAYYLPLEDISSFGSLTVFLFTFWATLSVQGGRRAIASLSWLLLLLLAAVVISWSRATWAAAIFSIALVAWRYFSTRARLICGLSLSLLVLIVNINADRENWVANPYLVRLVTLLRIEGIQQKDPTRFRLYDKAAKMIREKPVTGHGIGSFYLKSTRYATPGDPYGATPDFAHNFLLQIAAELGIPCALMVLMILVGPVARGWFAKKQHLASEGSSTWNQGRIAEALTLALVVYLVTQLSANSLNVYITHQLLVWFSVAALVQLNLRHS